MPGRPVRTCARANLPPAIHPQELPFCRQLRRNHRFGQPQKVQRFRYLTVRQIVATRNRKTFRSCAETVEEETCLWTLEENREDLSP
jgi:hypothetical protein